MKGEAWPKVRLGEVLRLSLDPHSVEADREYPNLGILSFGRGLFHKPPISGATTSARTLFRVRTGQFIYSRLFAFEGAYGLVTPDFDGHFVSNEFPTFDADPTRLLPEFVHAYFRRRDAWQVVAMQTTGMGNRRQRVQPERLLAHEIPLPPLAEQRRVVRRIAHVETELRRAEALHAEASHQVSALTQSFVIELRRSLTAPERPLEDVCEILDRLRKPVNSSERASRPGSVPYYGAGGQIGCIDEFLFDEPLLILAEDGGPFDWRCAYLIDGKSWVNNHAHVLRGTSVSNVWLGWMLRSTDLQPYLSGSTRSKLPQGPMRRIPIPTPVISEQEQLCARIAEIDSRAAHIEQIHAQCADELAVLLPAVLDRAFRGEL